MKKPNLPLSIADVKSELSLCYAVLDRAIIDCIGTTYIADKHIQNQAIRWINQPITELELPWTFAWICTQLNIDAKTAQNRIIEFVKLKPNKLGLMQHRNVITAVLDDIPPIGDYSYYYHEDYYDVLPDKPPISQDITLDENKEQTRKTEQSTT